MHVTNGRSTSMITRLLLSSSPIPMVALGTTTRMTFQIVGWCTLLLVHAFAGAKLCDVIKLLDLSRDLFANVKNIVIAVGANNRTEDPHKTMSALQGIKGWGERTAKTVFYMGMPIFPQLIQSQREALARINDEVRDIFQQLLYPLPPPRRRTKYEPGRGSYPLYGGYSPCYHAMHYSVFKLNVSPVCTEMFSCCEFTMNLSPYCMSWRICYQHLCGLLPHFQT